jgi:3-oxoacyl-[acyl-carrier protein] reductase
MDDSLRDRVALVTGASRGIGAACAKRLAAAGCAVVVNYRERREAALAVLEEVEKSSRGMLFQADVTDKRQVEAMARAVAARFGGIDILVNNAFFPFEMGPFHELSWDAVERALDHELAALHHCAQAFLPAMIARKSGRVIAVSSRLAQQPLPRMGAYAAAKAALEAAAATMALELGPHGITVNVVTPAFTITEASAGMPEDFKERVRRSRPLQRHLYPEDVAGAVAFLAGAEAAMITGANILVTGGSHLQL